MTWTAALFPCGMSCTSEHSHSSLAAPFLIPPKIVELLPAEHRLATTEKQRVYGLCVNSCTSLEKLDWLQLRSNFDSNVKMKDRRFQICSSLCEPW